MFFYLKNHLFLKKKNFPKEVFDYQYIVFFSFLIFSD